MDQLYAVIRHESVVERIHQIEAAEEVLGRSTECAIWLPDKSVSRKHATIVKRGTKFLIRDEKSRNGTFVNSIRISEAEVLNDESVIDIGSYSLIMCFSIGVALKHTAPLANESTLINKSSSLPKEDTWRPRERLTEAQCRVYDLFLEGLSERDVSVRLGISVSTVHTHAKAIYRRLSVSSRSELLSRRIREPGQGENTAFDDA